MYFILYPEKDATIYERYPTKNTGMDAVLEIGKEIITSGSIDYKYSSRALIRFNFQPWYDLISNNTVGINPSSIIQTTGEMNLKLKSCFAPVRLAASYSIEARPIVVPDTNSWENGAGLIDSLPIVTDGVSWTNYQSGSAWWTGSYPIFNSASWATIPGGGNYITPDVYGTNMQHVFTTESADLNLNVYASFIVLSGYPSDYSSPTNYGFLLKLSDIDEQNNKEIAPIRYFSAETNTIYPPSIHWWYYHHGYTSGSSSLANRNNLDIHIKNFKQEYSSNEKVIFELSVRNKFPTRTFSTASAYLTQYRLPEQSFYSIKDAYSDEIIVPYCAGTILDCSYGTTTFNHWMSNLMPERWYRITFRVNWDYDTSPDLNVIEYDNDLIFKVVR